MYYFCNLMHFWWILFTIQLSSLCLKKIINKVKRNFSFKQLNFQQSERKRYWSKLLSPARCRHDKSFISELILTWIENSMFFSSGLLIESSSVEFLNLHIHFFTATPLENHTNFPNLAQKVNFYFICTCFSCAIIHEGMIK